MLTYDIYDVVRVPFPYTDITYSKTRPALVLSSYETFGRESGHSVLAMITTAKHSDFPLDVPIQHSKKAGLPVACKIRMKLVTLDERLIIEKVGSLHKEDRQAVTGALQQLIPLLQKRFAS